MGDAAGRDPFFAGGFEAMKQLGGDGKGVLEQFLVVLYAGPVAEAMAAGGEVEVIGADYRYAYRVLTECPPP